MEYVLPKGGIMTGGVLRGEELSGVVMFGESCPFTVLSLVNDNANTISIEHSKCHCPYCLYVKYVKSSVVSVLRPDVF